MFTSKNNKGKKNQSPSIVIELTQEQRERWEQAAQKRGMSLEAFVKGCVNAEIHREQ